MHIHLYSINIAILAASYEIDQPSKYLSNKLSWSLARHQTPPCSSGLLNCYSHPYNVMEYVGSTKLLQTLKNKKLQAHYITNNSTANHPPILLISLDVTHENALWFGIRHAHPNYMFQIILVPFFLHTILRSCERSGVLFRIEWSFLQEKKTAAVRPLINMKCGCIEDHGKPSVMHLKS